LENLLKIGQLKQHPPDADEIDRLLGAAPFTVGLDSKRMVVLDTLRRQRNVADYTGDEIDQSTVEHCIAEAKRLLDDVIDWREVNRPNLVRKKK
jgi:hypothetical protein